jgi:hypothetical protein
VGGRTKRKRACRQVLAIWPGQTDAAYLLDLMAYNHGNLDLAVAHVREASRSPRAPAVYFSDFAEICRQKGLLAEGEEAGRRTVALAPNPYCLEQSRHWASVDGAHAPHRSRVQMFTALRVWERPLMAHLARSADDRFRALSAHS